MTIKWLLIVAGVYITSCSKYYTVSVPNSMQGQKDLLYLQQWAKVHNYYFEKVSEQTDTFRRKIAESLNLEVYDLDHTLITARDFVRFIKQNGKSPVIDKESRVAAIFRKHIKPAEYYLRQIKVIQRAEAGQRNKPKPIVNRTKG